MFSWFSVLNWGWENFGICDFYCLIVLFIAKMQLLWNIFQHGHYAADVEDIIIGRPTVLELLVEKLQFWCTGARHGPPQSTAVSPWCIWQVGTTQDLEDTVYSPHVKCRSQRNHWLFTAFLLVDRCLQLFGHIAHSSSRKDHHLALAVAIWQVPPDWKRPVGRPSYNWLRAIEADLGPLNFDLVTAWRKATTQDNILWTQQRSSGVRYERKTAIANRSRVSCAHSMSRASMITPWPWKYFRIIF